MEKSNKHKDERDDYVLGVQLLKGEFIELTGTNITKAFALRTAENLAGGFTHEKDGRLLFITKYNILSIEIKKIIKSDTDKNGGQASTQ